MERKVVRVGKTVYVHFSFRRPKGKNYGIFATAMYADYEGKRLIVEYTRAFKLWKNQQFVTAIQSYEHALYCIWDRQKDMEEAGITDCMLVTDNSILARWIEDNYSRPEYTYYMTLANSKYRIGGPKEIFLNVGLMDVVKSEKSYKFCREELIRNRIPVEDINKPSGYYGASGGKSVSKVVNENTVNIKGLRDERGNTVSGGQAYGKGKGSEQSGYSGQSVRREEYASESNYVSLSDYISSGSSSAKDTKSNEKVVSVNGKNYSDSDIFK